jgi:hypothetical protein
LEKAVNRDISLSRFPADRQAKLVALHNACCVESSTPVQPVKNGIFGSFGHAGQGDHAFLVQAMLSLRTRMGKASAITGIGIQYRVYLLCRF